MSSFLNKELKGSQEESWFSGGTAGFLPHERALASFDVKAMSEALYGGADGVKRRKFILMPTKEFGPLKYEWDREKMMATSIADFINIHKEFVEEGYVPQRDEVSWMSEMSQNSGSLMPHFGLFLPTLLGQGSPAQVMAWLPRALNFQIIGCYAQTELSHGSNVRGLRTTATYDRATQEFVLNTPVLGAMKWWNSNIGLCATHAAVYAQLIINGKEFGLHVFFVQVRDENHRPLPGIEMGDVGKKLGDNAIDTGYMRLQNVRIPREHLFSKRQHVEPDGSYVKHGMKGNKAAASRGAYLTMMQARSGMVSIAGGKLSIATTIAVRYSAVRRQGFKAGTSGGGHRAEESPVLDYQVQSYRVLKQLAIAYTMRASGNWMSSQIAKFSSAADSSSDNEASLLDTMPEIHACSAGLKGLCTFLASEGIEDLRKCCGGHGYLLNSGIAALGADYVWQVSAEGDWVVLLLQTARYLMRARKDALNGKALTGLSAGLSALKDEAHSVEQLLEPQQLLALYQHRSLIAVGSAGDKLDRKVQHGTPPAVAWNQCAVALKTAAEFHVSYFMLSNFIDVIRGQQDRAVVATLNDLCGLFALQDMMEGRGWVGILSRETMSLVESGVDVLLGRLRPNAVTLVDAFDIPDRILNSSIGRSDGNVYEALFDAAQQSTLNRTRPFKAYAALEPHLDKDFLKLRGKACEEIRDANSKL